MSPTPDFDTTAAHKHFAAQCFNKTWELIDKKDRSDEDDEQMILTALASLWHWYQRDDRTDQNLSVGYWQVSRVYALAGQADNARRYAQASVRFSKDEPPFYQAYAYEALARAEMVAGNRDETEQHLTAARKLTESVTDPDGKKFLLADLATIK